VDALEVVDFPAMMDFSESSFSALVDLTRLKGMSNPQLPENPKQPPKNTGMATSRTLFGGDLQTDSGRVFLGFPIGVSRSLCEGLF
jgi:hypothetical protein